MGNQTWNEANSLFWLKHYRDKVAAFESGDIYVRMRKEHREELLESIRSGKYKPSPVRRVEIPKDNGGVRKLGIPTVIDRIVQQAIAQVLTPIYEPKFSDGSYGYRPHRSAKDAILKVRSMRTRDTDLQYASI